MINFLFLVIFFNFIVLGKYNLVGTIERTSETFAGAGILSVM